MPRKADTAEQRERNRTYQNAWYHANKESALRTRRKRITALSEAVRRFKAAAGCRRCGEKHPACLDFHRPDPSAKEINPTDLVRAKGWSIERILDELRALEVLCANCHRKVHYEWFVATGSTTMPPPVNEIADEGDSNPPAP